MAKAGYMIDTEGAITLSAATAKSILGIQGTSGFGVDLKGFTVSFDGVTASAVPVLVEVMYATFATNAPGTNSTNVTERQIYGRSITAGFVGAQNWTTEPTALTNVWPSHFLLDPNKGLVVYDWPLAESPDSAVSEGFVIRCNAPATVAVRASLRFERT